MTEPHATALQAVIQQMVGDDCLVTAYYVIAKTVPADALAAPSYHHTSHGDLDTLEGLVRIAQLRLDRAYRRQT